MKRVNGKSVLVPPFTQQKWRHGCLHVQIQLFLRRKAAGDSRVNWRKTRPISGIEERLDRICQAQGAEALNALRDAARKLAVPLRMEDSFRHLNAMVDLPTVQPRNRQVPTGGVQRPMHKRACFMHE